MATTGAMLTFQEFEQLPDRPGKDELLRGELFHLPVADDRLHTIAETLRDLLKAALEKAHARGESQDLGKAHLLRGYRLSLDTLVQSDVSITTSGQRVEKYLIGAPAVVVEVISPSHTQEAKDIKLDLYFEFGAREVWLIYPKTRYIDVYTSPVTFTRHRGLLQTPLIPGFTLDIAALLA